jgi:hypothetical protein
MFVNKKLHNMRAANKVHTPRKILTSDLPDPSKFAITARNKRIRIGVSFLVIATALIFLRDDIIALLRLGLQFLGSWLNVSLARHISDESFQDIGSKACMFVSIAMCIVGTLAFRSPAPPSVALSLKQRDLLGMKEFSTKSVTESPAAMKPLKPLPSQQQHSPMQLQGRVSIGNASTTPLRQSSFSSTTSSPRDQSSTMPLASSSHQFSPTSSSYSFSNSVLGSPSSPTSPFSTPTKPRYQQTSMSGSFVGSLQAAQAVMNQQKQAQQRLSFSPLSASPSSPSDSFHSYSRYSGAYGTASAMMYQMSKSLVPTTTSDSAYGSDSPNLDSSYLGISDADLNLWIQRLRRWLENFLLQPVADCINRVKSLPTTGSTLMLGSPVNDIAAQRIRVEYSLYMGPFASQPAQLNYVSERIAQLSQSPDLTIFEHRPTEQGTISGSSPMVHDAKIIMELFFRRLLVQLPTVPEQQDFLQKYFIAKGQSAPDSDDTIAIQEYGTDPPHYRVFVGKASVDPKRGHDNVFAAIVIFLYIVRERHNNRLMRIDMSSSMNKFDLVFGRD